jgi:hypothetical protein
MAQCRNLFYYLILFVDKYRPPTKKKECVTGALVQNKPTTRDPCCLNRWSASN